MYKFLVALAEMFSAFAARLHDMSESVPDTIDDSRVRQIVNEEITDDMIRDIVQEELGTDSVNADDVIGLERYIIDSISEYDFTDRIDQRAFHTAVQNLVWAYADERGINTNVIYVHAEVSEMMRYLRGRADIWREAQSAEQKRIETLAVNAYKRANGIQETVDHPCPPCPPLHIRVKSDEDVKI